MKINANTFYDGPWYMVSVVYKERFYGVFLVKSDLDNIKKDIKNSVLLDNLEDNELDIVAYSSPIDYIPREGYIGRLLTKGEAIRCEELMKEDAINAKT